MPSPDDFGHAEDAIPPAKRTNAWAWGICWLMFASTILNYMDRQAVAVVGEKITAEFQIRFEDLGWIIAAFQLSYAFFQVPAGFLVDRLDVRKTYALAVAWWSLAAIVVAYSPTLGLLMASRAILGIGEAFNWPCALKVTGTILPPADRSLGNGIFNSGAAVGAVLTPLLVTPLTLWLGWRSAFALIGLIGFVWVGVWLAITGGARAREFQAAKQPTSDGPRRSLSGRARASFGGLLAIAILGGYAGFSWRVPTDVHLPDLNQERGVSALLTVKAVENVWVKAGEELASLKTGETTTSVKSDVEGVVKRLELIAGEVTVRGQRLLVLDAAPLGLSAIWLAIAFLMLGILVIPLLLSPDDLAGSSWTESLGEVVRMRRFWVLVVVSVSVNICWHFLVNWLPTYLKTDRNMTFVAGTLLSSVPFLAADVGNIAGGWLSRALARSGMSTTRARGWVVSGCALLISTGAWVGRVQDNTITLALLAVMALGTAAFMANYFAYAQDVSSKHTGLIVGILGGLGNLFAAGFAPIAGRIKDVSGGFGPVFLVVGFLPFLGLAAILLAWGRDSETPTNGEA